MEQLVCFVHFQTWSMNTTKKSQQKRGNRDDHPNKLYDVLFRHDGCAMVLFRGLVRCQADSRIEALKQMYADWRGDLFKVRSNLKRLRDVSKKRTKTDGQ